jgi:hypothetical protein
MTDPKPGDLKVWYIPQIGAHLRFETPVPDLATAAIVLDVLGKFALFEFHNRIKGDYADAGGVARFDDLDGDLDWFGVDDTELRSALEARS